MHEMYIYHTLKYLIYTYIIFWGAMWLLNIYQDTTEETTPSPRVCEH